MMRTSLAAFRASRKALGAGIAAVVGAAVLAGGTGEGWFRQSGVVPIPAGRHAPEAPGRLEDHVRRLREIELAESPAVLNVRPRVEVDPAGGFLVADASEAQLRRYGADGELLWAFGRKGRGPGEFLRLSAALRAPGDTVLAAEINGRVSLISPDGGRLVRMRQTPLGPLYDAAAAGDSLVVFAARAGGDATSDLLHLWNARRDTIVASFFPPPRPPRGLEGAYAFAGTVDVAARGDTLAATFALTDTVFLFDLRGRLLERVPVPFLAFRKPAEPMPKLASLDEYRRWAAGFSAISQLFWGSDGSFYVQYFDTDGVAPKWRLLHMTRRGERLFEALDTPELLAVSRADRSLFFVRPEAETPASWMAAAVVR